MSEAPKSASETRASEEKVSVRELSVDELRKRVVDDGKKMFQMLRRRTEADHWHRVKSSPQGSISSITMNVEYDRRTAYLDLVSSNLSLTDHLAIATEGETAGPAHRIAKVIMLGMEHMKGASPADAAFFVALDICEAILHHSDSHNMLMIRKLNSLLERDFRNFFGHGEIPNNYFIQPVGAQDQIRQIAYVKAMMSAKLHGPQWQKEISENPEIPEEDRMNLPSAEKATCIGFVEELLRIDVQKDPAERMVEEFPSLVPVDVLDVMLAGSEAAKAAKTFSKKVHEENPSVKSVKEDRTERPEGPPVGVLFVIPDPEPSNVVRRAGQRKEDLSGESTPEILNNIKRFIRTDFGGQDAHTLIMAELAKAGLPATQGVADFVINKMRFVAAGIQKRITPRVDELRKRHAQSHDLTGGAQ